MRQRHRRMNMELLSIRLHDYEKSTILESNRHPTPAPVHRRDSTEKNIRACKYGEECLSSQCHMSLLTPEFLLLIPAPQL
jgi:hypothetical protein